MASLFGDLPAAQQRASPPRAASPPAAAAEEEPPTKRARSAEPAPSGDEVSAALERLTAHVGNPKKFRKVAELGTKLLADGQLARKHSKAVFTVRALAPPPQRRAWPPRLTARPRTSSSRPRWRTRRA